MTWGLLSKYRNVIYGYAAIWIILFHGIRYKGCELHKCVDFLTGYLWHGNIGVEMFLFMSGISLYFSIQDKSISDFYKSRFYRVYIPFCLILGSYWLYLFTIDKINFTEVLLHISFFSFWFKGDKLGWYIALTLILYMLYPYIYIYILKRKNKLLWMLFWYICVYIGCYILKQFNPTHYKTIEIALTRIPIFLFGCYCGELVYDDAKFSKSIKLITFVVVMIGWAYFFEYPVSLTKTYRTTFLFLAPSIVIWSTIVLDYINSKNLNRLFDHLGILSLELYLSHEAIRRIWYKSFLYTDSKVINYFSYIIFVLIGSYVFSLFFNWISKKVIKSKVMNI